MDEVRKTIRLSKEEFDFIMNDEDLARGSVYSRYDPYRKSFSVRFRNLIERYKWQKKRIEDLVRQYQELSDKATETSDNSDIGNLQNKQKVKEEKE